MQGGRSPQDGVVKARWVTMFLVLKRFVLLFFYTFIIQRTRLWTDGSRPLLGTQAVNKVWVASGWPMMKLAEGRAFWKHASSVGKQFMGPGAGIVYREVLKTSARKGLGVQVPSRLPTTVKFFDIFRHRIPSLLVGGTVRFSDACQNILLESFWQ